MLLVYRCAPDLQIGSKCAETCAHDFIFSGYHISISYFLYLRSNLLSFGGSFRGGLANRPLLS